MAQTTIERRKDSLIIYRLRQLEQDVVALKANQLQELQFGNILLTSLQQTGAIQANGTSIVTGSGLNPLSNFPLHQIQMNVSDSTTSTSYVDVSGSTLPSFTTSGPNTQVLFLVSVNAYNGDNAFNGSYVTVNVVDSIDGSIISYPINGNWALTGFSQEGSPPYAITGYNYNSSDQLIACPALITMTAGTHSVKLQYKSNVSGTAHIDFFLLGYIVIGQQTA